ncbi:MAG: ribbon-helix-helix protein, CopG family [Candidatus Bathyarchaeota archaeon]|jgi:Arc/MetJ-type ribon-helix-helix transcriptional regulator|nr:MAG: ribbon-helix-helix protein, CopG family [Candidatus Bathyarchaeota archaeon]
MKLITLYIPEPYIKALDRLVDERYYPNRAEAIRVAIRDLLSVEVWERIGNEEISQQGSTVFVPRRSP